MPPPKRIIFNPDPGHVFETDAAYPFTAKERNRCIEQLLYPVSWVAGLEPQLNGFVEMRRKGIDLPEIFKCGSFHLIRELLESCYKTRNARFFKRYDPKSSKHFSRGTKLRFHAGEK